MARMTVDLPDESLLALEKGVTSVGAELLLAAAVELYELGRLSSGAAATLTGIPRTLFLSKLADYGVPTFRLTREELVRDLGPRPGRRFAQEAVLAFVGLGESCEAGIAAEHDETLGEVLRAQSLRLN